MLQKIRLAFRALHHRDLRLFFAGQSVSLVGTWMQQVAMSWLVYRMTGSAFVLGLIGFCSQFPGFFMAPVAGALADRWSRYRMVVAAQTAAMLQATLLAVLVVGGWIQVWHLVVLALAAGVINGIDVPARQSLLVKLVGGTEDLPNAIALNSSIFNAARLVGPALAGVLIAWMGEGPVFVLNAVSYVAVLAALAALRVERGPGEASGSLARNIREGLAYAFRFAPIRDILVVLGVMSLVGVPYVVLLPVYAADVLGGDAATLGLLSSCAGGGALVAALMLASRDTVRGLGTLIARATALLGGGLAALGAVGAWVAPAAPGPAVWVSCAILVLCGFGVMAVTASSNTVLQSLVEEHMRGRVMSLYTMAFLGVTPVGSLTGGALAERLGAPLVLAMGGAGCLALAVWFALRVPRLRPLVLPVYARHGILPEVAAGLQSASELRPKA